MPPTEQTLSGLGLALLALAGTTAGFLAASLPTASPDTREAIEPGEALALDPTPERIHLAALEDRPASVLVFDAEASFQGRIVLDPHNESDALRALSEGASFLLVPEISGPVELQLPADSSTETHPARVHETHHPLVAESQGRVSEQVTVRVPNRPASLSLALDGTVEGLEVDVRTSEGRALRQEASSEAIDDPRQVHLAPGNLTNGTYRVSVDAARLDGRLGLTTRTFPVDEPQRPTPPDETIDQMGALLARAQQGQAWQIPVPSSGSLTLAVERGGWADARVYAPDDRLVHRVEVGQEGPAWRWSSNETRRPAYDVVQLDVRQGTHTVYAKTVRAETDATVYVLVEDREEAPPGRQIDVQTRTLEVPYPSAGGSTSTETARYPGGLLGVRVAGGEGAAVDRTVRVESPEGTVFERHDSASGDEAGVLADTRRRVDNFGPGPLDISVNADAGEGAVRLQIRHYAP